MSFTLALQLLIELHGTSQFSIVAFALDFEAPDNATPILRVWAIVVIMAISTTIFPRMSR